MMQRLSVPALNIRVFLSFSNMVLSRNSNPVPNPQVLVKLPSRASLRRLIFSTAVSLREAAASRQTKHSTENERCDLPNTGHLLSLTHDGLQRGPNVNQQTVRLLSGREMIHKKEREELFHIMESKRPYALLLARV